MRAYTVAVASHPSSIDVPTSASFWTGSAPVCPAGTNSSRLSGLRGIELSPHPLEQSPDLVRRRSARLVLEHGQPRAEGVLVRHTMADDRGSDAQAVDSQRLTGLVHHGRFR